MVKFIRLLMLALSFFILPTLAAQPKVSLSLSKDKAWQREQVILTLEVTNKDKFSKLDVDRFEQSGLTIVPIEQQRTVEKDEVTLIKHWMLFPHTAEEHLLELPRIRYRPNSGRPIQLELPKLALRVRPLPIYIPPTMPVGKVKITSNWENGWLISSKRLYEWQLSVLSTQVSPDTLPAISRQLRTTEDIKILPMQNTINSQQDQTSLSHQQDYKIPLKAQTLGRLNLPNITVQFFDPEIGKLQQASLAMPFVLVINRWLLGIISLLALGVLMLASLYLFPKAKRCIQEKKLKQQALENLKKANNYQQIKRALEQLASENGAHRNISLEQFLMDYEGKHPAYQSLRKLVDQLKEYEFSATLRNHKKTDLSAIRSGLFNLLR